MNQANMKLMKSKLAAGQVRRNVSGPKDALTAAQDLKKTGLQQRSFGATRQSGLKLASGDLQGQKRSRHQRRRSARAGPPNKTSPLPASPAREFKQLLLSQLPLPTSAAPLQQPRQFLKRSYRRARFAQLRLQLVFPGLASLQVWGGLLRLRSRLRHTLLPARRGLPASPTQRPWKDVLCCTYTAWEWKAYLKDREQTINEKHNSRSCLGSCSCIHSSHNQLIFK